MFLVKKQKEINIYQYEGFYSCLMMTYQKGGIAGLYQGMSLMFLQ